MRNFASWRTLAHKLSVPFLLSIVLSSPSLARRAPRPASPQAYCTPGNPNGCNGSALITRVELTGSGLNNTSTCQVDNFGNGYSVFAPTGSATGTVQQGVTYRLGATSSSSDAYLVAWADWNQDEVFSTNESVTLTAYARTTANVPAYWSLTVPTTAALGPTRLRVRSRAVTGSIPDPCASLSSGETEDYTITVVAASGPAPTYCQAYNFVGGCNAASITKVELTGTTLSSASTCQLDQYGNAYRNYPATGSTTGTVQQSVTYRLGLASANSNAYLRAWVDWNHDGVFAPAEASSVLYSSTANSPAYVGLTVPATALLGPTTMRVRSQANGVSIATSAACEVFASGETEEYTITVTAAPSPAAVYCTPGNFIGGCTEASIKKVEITGTTLSNSSTCQLDQNGNAHSVFQPTGSATGTVQQGVTYRFGVTSANSSAYIRAWIDWNHDGVFSTVEDVYLTNSSTANAPAYQGLTIPSDAVLGATTMRVRSRADGATISDLDVCTAFSSGETEDYTITVAAAPSPAAVYCTPGHFISGCNSASIKKVEITGTTLSNSSTCQLDQYGNAYSVFPATGTATGTVQQGVTYRLGVTNANSSAYMRVWVDWNHDGVFSTVEDAYLTNSSTANAPAYQGLAVPADAVLGATTMRVRSRADGATISDLDPCTAFSTGETEDYTITVAAAPSPAATYCTPSHFVSGCNSGSITKVELTGTTLSNTSTCQLDTYGNAYSVFQPTGSATGTVQQSTAYRFSVTSNVSGADMAAWIDWNHDGVLNSTEYVLLTTSSTANTPVNVSLAVPAAAALGPTTVRVRAQSSTSFSSTDACTAYGTGETEEYTITVTTASSQPTYCTPGHPNGCNGTAPITKVELTGTTLNSTSTCQVDNFGNAYSSFPATGSTTGTVQRDVTYRLGVTSSVNSAYLAVWIDWNQDGTFSSSEYLTVTTSSNANSATYLGLTVPFDAVLGQTTMRVRSRASGATIGSLESCTSFGSGEAEDYVLTVAAAPNPAAYCTPGNFIGGCGTAPITKVELTGTTLSNTSACQLNSFGNAYSIFQPTGSATGTVQQGVTYRFGVTSSNAAYLAAWVDWDQDGAFESSEFVIVSAGSSANTADYIGLSVPADAVLGQTTVRVRSRTTSATIGSAEACTAFGSGETEDYTITVAAAPNPGPAYCTPSNFISGCSSAPITKVELTGTTLNNSSSCQLNSFGNAYTVFPATGSATATVQQGVTYRFGLTSSTSAFLAAWVDWDQDNAFESSEFIIVSTGNSAGSATYIGLTVPAGAVLGQTTMRVRSRTSSATIGSLESCTAFGSGETEDYTITVAPAPNPGPAYCTPGNFISGCGSVPITKVELTGTTLNNASTCQLDQYGNAYIIYQPTGSATGTVQQGVTYRLGVTTTGNSAYLAAWVDWNQDGTFANSEFIYVSTGSTANAPSYIGLTVPAGAALGQTVMRVRSRSSSGTIGTGEACAAFGSGETEDYTITVAPAPNPAPTYCTPGNFVNGCNSATITRVQLTGSGLNNASTCQLDQYGNAYTQFPATGTATGNVQPGTGYSLGVTSASNNAYLSVWVDWNQDGQFATNEYSSVSTGSTANTPAFITLTVPAGAAQGQTTMRVRSRSSSSTIGSGEACGFFSTGETEDYRLFVGNCSLAAPTISASSVCAGGTLTLTATGVPAGAAYQWSGPNGFNSTQPNPQIQNAQTANSGTYVLTITSDACSATSAGLNVAVSPLPTVTINPNRSTALCQGESVTLTASGASSYVWNTGATTASITVSAAGTYSVTGTNAASCTSASPATVAVTVSPVPTATASANGPTTFCAGGSVTLTATATVNATYQWLRGGNPITGATNATYTATTAGAYSVVVTVSGCSATSAAISVNVTTAPSAAFAFAASTYCLSATNPTPTVTGTSGGTFSATPAGLSLNATTGAINLSASTAGTYTITYALTSPCPASQTQTVTLTTAPTTAFSYPTGSRCAGTTGSLSPTLAAGATAGSFSATPTGISLNPNTGIINLATSAAGIYTVTNSVAASNGCAASSATTTVTISAPPTASISANGPTTFCTGGSVTLTASGGTSYLWSTGATTPSITVSIGGQYSVTATNAAGCSAASATTTVTVNSVPSAAFTYSAPSYCLSGANPTPTVTGANGGTFSATPAGLSLNAASGQINLSASTAGTYSVTYSVGGNCPASLTRTVTLTTAPIAAFSYPAGGSRCAGAPTTAVPSLAAGGSAGTFTATPAGLGLNTSTGVVSLATSAAGTYTVTNTIAASGSCAAATATATLTIMAAPTATISASGPTTFCAGGSVTLTANGGTSYLWSTGATTTSITVTAGGAYTVLATNAAGCSATSAATTVTVTPAPSAAFAYAASTYCLNGANPSPTITGASGGTFAAAPAGLSLNATTGQINLAASVAGTYSVTYRVGGTCPASQSQTITLTTSPQASFSYAAGVRCAGSASTVAPTLGAGASAGSFSATPAGLSLSATSGVINLATSQAGTYTVTNSIAASGSCAASTATATITVLPAPVASISHSGPLTFCAGGSVTLTASAGATYLWSTGATSQSITVSTSGQYSVTVTNASTCAATSPPIAVSVTSAPSAAFAYATATYCRSGANPTPSITGASGGTFSAAPAGLSLNAATGAINLTASTVGTYVVTYSLGGTCPASATQTVTVTTAPLASFSYQAGTRCAGAAGTLAPTFGAGATAGTFTATPAGLSVNATTGVINLATSAAGTYTVTNNIAASGGCTAATATATVSILAAPTASISASGPTTFCTGGSVTLTASGGASYLWSTGATTPSITVTTGGQYSVTATNAAGCSATSVATTVTVTAAPSAAFAYAAALFCLSGTNPVPTISGASGGTFTATPAGLSLNATTGAINLGASTAGTYTVTYSVGTTCSASQTQILTLTAAPTASFSYAAGGAFCAGAVGTLLPTLNTGSTAGTFSATPAGLTIDATTGVVNLATSTAGTYSISNVVTGGAGCTPATATTTLMLSARPIVVITGLGAAYCTTDAPVVLTGTIGGLPALLGFTIDGQPAIAFTPLTLGAGPHTVALTGTNANGCDATTTLTVTVNATPATPIITTQNVGNTVVLTSSAATGNQWYLGGQPIPGATGVTYTATGAAQTGTYTVVSTVAGCASAVSAPQSVVLGVDTEAIATNVALYPNPTTGWVVLELTNWRQAGRLLVYDATGRAVLQVAVPAQTARQELDVQALPVGQYLVRLVAADGRAVVRRLTRE